MNVTQFNTCILVAAFLLASCSEERPKNEEEQERRLKHLEQEVQRLKIEQSSRQGLDSPSVSSSRSEVQSAPESPEEKSPPEQPSLAEQALQLCRNHFDTITLRNGDTWYTAYSLPMTGQIIVEARNVNFIVREGGPPSAAEKLNGLEWHGSIQVTAEVSRDRRATESKWNAWNNGLTGFGNMYNLRKTNGEWEFSQKPAFDRRPFQAQIEELRGIKLSENRKDLPETSRSENTNNNLESVDRAARVAKAQRDAQNIASISLAARAAGYRGIWHDTLSAITDLEKGVIVVVGGQNASFKISPLSLSEKQEAAKYLDFKPAAPGNIWYSPH